MFLVYAAVLVPRDTTAQLHGWRVSAATTPLKLHESTYRAVSKVALQVLLLLKAKCSTYWQHPLLLAPHA